MCTKNKHRSFLRHPGSLSVILVVSTLTLWLRQQWDEGCFSIVVFSKMIHFGLCSCLLHLSRAARHAVQGALHGGDGSEQSCGWGGSLREEGGDMKAEINEVSGTVLLPGHCSEEAVCGRPTFIIWGCTVLNTHGACGNLNTRSAVRVQRLVMQPEERHQAAQCVFYFVSAKMRLNFPRALLGLVREDEGKKYL